MKSTGSNLKSGIATLGRLVALLSCLGLTACVGLRKPELVNIPDYHPENIYKACTVLPPAIKRVAMLPMMVPENDGSLLEGRQSLETVLLAELSKTRKFEVCPISSESVAHYSGKLSWAADEELPAQFFDWVRQVSACDAVLFTRLTEFRGYAPLAVGWQMRLVDARTRQTLWAVDEVFDAGQERVRAAARQYGSAELRPGEGAWDDWLLLNSPRRFGQYAAAETLSNLPGR